MRGPLFSDLVVSRPGGARTARWAGPIPVSMMLHGGALAALVLIPVMRSAELPSPVAEPPIRFTVFPTPPPVVRLDPGSGGPRPRPRAPGAPPRVGRPMVAPAVVPELVTEEPPSADEISTTAIGEPCVGCVDPGVTPGPQDGSGVGDGSRGGGAPALVRPGGDVREPRKLRHVAPVYPPLAENVGIGATVILECRIDTEGRVAEVTVLKGHPLFDAAAIAAVRQWAYTPTLLNGQPVSILMTVTVRFISRR